MTMGFERSMTDLDRKLHDLAASVKALQVALVVDRPVKPQNADVALFDQFELAVDDVQGWIEEASSSVRCARQAVAGKSADWTAARRMLGCSQQLFQRTQWHFALELESHQRCDQLVRLGRERRGEWPSWVYGVRDALQRCRTPLLETAEALSAVWMQMAEGGTASISVHAHSVGQEFRVSPASQGGPD